MRGAKLRENHMASSRCTLRSKYSSLFKDASELPGQEELDQMDEEIAHLKLMQSEAKEDLKCLSTRKDLLKSELQSLTSSLTNPQCIERIRELTVSNQLLETKLMELRAGTRKVDPVEKQKIDRSYSEFSKLWKLRKKMVDQA
jgi:hypothetical protein